MEKPEVSRDPSVAGRNGQVSLLRSRFDLTNDLSIGAGSHLVSSSATEAEDNPESKPSSVEVTSSQIPLSMTWAVWWLSLGHFCHRGDTLGDPSIPGRSVTLPGRTKPKQD